MKKQDRIVNVRARAWKSTTSTGALVAAMLFSPAAFAASNIETGNTYQSSNLGSSVNPDFKGGTLQLDSAAAIGNAFTVEDVGTNTIDMDGHIVTMSGAFTGAGPLTFTDSVGGGSVTLTSGGNTYSGATTINSGATVLLSDGGTLATSSSVTNNGTLDISQTTSGASLISLAGSGTVKLGAEALTLSVAAGTFSGSITGTGGLVITSGSETLTGANTYTGGTTITAGTLQIGASGTSGSITGNVADSGTLAFNRSDALTYDGVVSGIGGISQIGSGTTTLTGVSTFTGTTNISAGTLALSGNGSIANSSSVIDDGTFDISGTNGTSITTLSGTGTVQLGTQTLTLTGASGTFAGTIAGSGNLVIDGGSILLTGTSSYTGNTIITSGTLGLGASAIAYDVTDNATLAFSSASAIAMGGVVSGSGAVQQIGTGITTITSAQTYTGVTTISSGTLALSGGGSIAASSGVTDNANFDISATAGGSAIASLAGNGTVQLGVQTLTITNGAGTFSGVLSGTGGLTLTGGIQTLSGTNLYTGVTTIDGGTLVLASSNAIAASRVIDNASLDISAVTYTGIATSASVLSLGGSGTVILGTKTLILTNAGDSFSGTLSGTGGLTIAGGTEVLTAANTYTGNTTISSGTLMLSGAGNLATTSRVVDNGNFDVSATTGSTVTLASLSGAGTVTLGDRSINLVTAADIFSGTIVGSGGVTVSGGTQVLSGSNSYTGGTVIAGGTLQIGSGQAGGSIIGDVLDNGVLAFDRSDVAVFSGTVSGAGKVTQIGGGTTVLTGTNTYTGGTVISGGTLQIGNGGTSGVITGDVTDNGTLAFARSDTNSFAGAISGTGGVTLVSGTTVFTTVNSYSGTTLIDNVAALTLSGAGSIAASAVTDNGVLDVSATTGAPRLASLAGTGSVILGTQSLTLAGGTAADTASDFSGVISGSGGLSVTGGIQTLSGVNLYTGATAVQNATLSVTGSIVSSSGVSVGSGGTLAGTGTVSATSVGSGGTIAPGVAGAGTLHIDGNATFATTSNLAINLTGTTVSKLDVSGTAALAGALTVASADGSWLLGQKETILTAADGITGTFTLADAQSGGGAQFTRTLSYDADDVYLEVDLSKLSPLLPSGATANQVRVIGGIDSAIAAGDSLPAAVNNLASLTPTELGTAAGQMAGEIGSDVPRAGNALFAPFVDAIFDHIGDGQAMAPVSRHPHQDQVWASGLAGSSIDGADPAGGAHKLSSSASGFAGGVDWDLSSRFTLGAALSSGSTSFHLAGASGNGSANAFQLGVYGLAQFGPRFYGAFAAGVGLDNVDTHRTIAISGTDTLNAKFNAISYGGRYETGYELDWLTPYAALQDTLFQTPNYSETASSGTDSYALHYASQSSNTATLEIGARQQGDVTLDRFWTLRLSDRLAWAHSLSEARTAQASFVSLPDSGFTATGAMTARDAARISLGAGLKNRNGLGLDLHFEGDIAGHSQSYAGIAGLNFAW